MDNSPPPSLPPSMAYVYPATGTRVSNVINSINGNPPEGVFIASNSSEIRHVVAAEVEMPILPQHLPILTLQNESKNINNSQLLNRQGEAVEEDFSEFARAVRKREKSVEEDSSQENLPQKKAKISKDEFVNLIPEEQAWISSSHSIGTNAQQSSSSSSSQSSRYSAQTQNIASSAFRPSEETLRQFDSQIQHSYRKAFIRYFGESLLRTLLDQETENSDEGLLEIDFYEVLFSNQNLIEENANIRGYINKMVEAWKQFPKEMRLQLKTSQNPLQLHNIKYGMVQTINELEYASNFLLSWAIAQRSIEWILLFKITNSAVNITGIRIPELDESTRDGRLIYNIDDEEYKLCYLIHSVAQYGNRDLVEMFLGWGSSLFQTVYTPEEMEISELPIHYAVYGGDKDVVKLLLECAKREDRLAHMLLSFDGEGGELPIELAITYKNLPVFKLLLEASIEANIDDEMLNEVDTYIDEILIHIIYYSKEKVFLSAFLEVTGQSIDDLIRKIIKNRFVLEILKELRKDHAAEIQLASNELEKDLKDRQDTLLKTLVERPLTEEERSELQSTQDILQLLGEIKMSSR